MAGVTKQSGSADSGFTLVETLVTLVLSSIVFVGLVKEYSDSIGRAHDQKVISSTVLKAQAIVQMMGAEIRILGNGVPYDQANFQVGESTLSDTTVTEPVVIADSATNTQIGFRLNETGNVFLVTADFDPTGSLTISLTDVDGLEVNDPIYLSNSVIGGDDALYGVITAVNAGADTVTINAGYVASPAATFDTGTIVEEVPEIIYNSPADWSGITRDSGFGAVLVADNSTFTIEYQDYNGAALALPLTATTIVDDLRKISITVTVQSATKLTSGLTYTATATQVFSLRNLNYLF